MGNYMRYGMPLAAAALFATPALAQVAPPVLVPTVAPAISTIPATTAPAVAAPVVATVAPIDDLAPEAPAGVAASYTPPLRDAAGAYITPNRDLSPEETVWHMRVALNVAALGCRDADERQTVADYNAMLAAAHDGLDAAQTGMMARYKVKFGAAWQARNDDQMTKLYNFFAQTVAHDGFCATAKTVLHQAAAIEPADLTAFAAAALPQLEAPFTAFFAKYDSYRTTLAAWKSRHAPVVMVATAAAPTVVPARP